jgi:hypothetical protein
MRSRTLGILGTLTLLVAACSGGTTPAGATPSPTLVGGAGVSSAAPAAPSGGGPATSSTPATAPPTDNASPSTAGTGTILLHGTATGHAVQPLSTADQTVAFELLWNYGPDDIHDIHAFQFQSGSFTFSESIDGVCGGSRSEDGPLTPFSETFLVSGEMQDRDQASVSLTDDRLNSGNVAISATSSFAVSAPDPEGCADLSRAGVGVCTLEFQWLAVGQLKPDASCEDDSRGYTWTGHLAP